MDWQIIINLGVGAIFTIGGWFARQLWDSVKRLQEDMSEMRLHVSESYVKKSEIEALRIDLDKRFDRIELLLDRLFDKLDTKVDK